MKSTITLVNLYNHHTLRKTTGSILPNLKQGVYPIIKQDNHTKNFGAGWCSFTIIQTGKTGNLNLSNFFQ